MNLNNNILVDWIIPIVNLFIAGAMVWVVWKSKHNESFNCILCLKKHFNHHRKKQIASFYKKIREQIKKDQKIPLKTKDDEKVINVLNWWYHKLSNNAKNKLEFKVLWQIGLKKWDVENFWKLCSNDCLGLYLFDDYRYLWNNGQLFSLDILEFKKELNRKEIKELGNRIYELK